MRTKLFVSGFGEFGGVAVNPTELLIKQILENQPSSLKYDLGGCEVVEVSIEGAEQVVGKWGNIFKDLVSEEQSEKEEEEEFRGAFIHLGVDGSATTFRLETRGVNEATFRQEDRRGNTPIQEKIVADSPLEHFLPSPFPLEEWCKELNSTKTGTENNYATGDDAGLYVCNYLFYYSLAASQNLTRELNSTHSNSNPNSNSPSPSKPKRRISSQFVHVPPESVMPLEKQYRLLVDLLLRIKEDPSW